MVAFLACPLGLLVILIIGEVLAKYKLLKGEYLRKFIHIGGGTFIAAWPWLISWHLIELLGLAMVVVTILNHYFRFFSYHNHRASMGDIFLALAVLISAAITDNKVFFCLAILEVALADGLAAVTGIAFGKKWAYKIMGHKKTVIGSLVFWTVSLLILGVGLLSQSTIIDFGTYYLLLIFVPPLLTVIENVAIFGLDNLIVPIALVLLLKAVQS